MNLTANRGRLLFTIAVALLLLERLGMAGLALAGYGQSYFNWTSVVLPLTHIAVILFLVYTSDLLIYWLVIMWGVITAGNYAFKLWYLWNTASLADKAEWFGGKMLPKWCPIVVLIAFHIFVTLLFLLPSVRGFLAEQRSKLEFEESHSAPLPDESEKKKL